MIVVVVLATLQPICFDWDSIGNYRGEEGCKEERGRASGRDREKSHDYWRRANIAKYVKRDLASFGSSKTAKSQNVADGRKMLAKSSLDVDSSVMILSTSDVDLIVCAVYIYIASFGRFVSQLAFVAVRGIHRRLGQPKHGLRHQLKASGHSYPARTVFDRKGLRDTLMPRSLQPLSLFAALAKLRGRLNEWAVDECAYAMSDIMKFASTESPFRHWNPMPLKPSTVCIRSPEIPDPKLGRSSPLPTKFPALNSCLDLYLQSIAAIMTGSSTDSDDGYDGLGLDDLLPVIGSPVHSSWRADGSAT